MEKYRAIAAELKVLQESRGASTGVGGDGGREYGEGCAGEEAQTGATSRNVDTSCCGCHQAQLSTDPAQLPRLLFGVTSATVPSVI